MVSTTTERKYLSKYDLDVKLFEQFNLKVFDVYPLRNVFIVSTDGGDKILKRVEYTKEELNYIVEAVKYIKNRFNRVISFNKSINGNPFILWNNEMYCVMDVVKGRECDFNNPMDIIIASKGLAELHRASEGFKPTITSKYNNGKIIDNLIKKQNEIEFFKKLANMHEIKSEFDKIFLESVDSYLVQVQESINELKKSSYFKVCSEEDKVVLCHHDLAYHNIIIEDEEAHFIDFDYSIMDLKVHDLSNLINKVIKNFAFDMEKAELILNSYRNVSSIDKRELEILNALLIFPEYFYTICKDYYGKRKDWDEETFIYRINKKNDFKEDREEFLEHFKKWIII